ncbi:MAG: PTS sugar transporter subunit IIA [Candidatus Hydrogenedentes bacterium]|nr:PTS sugar transporter subunit IIA [Candidatus Hydrogenedentota bacterium]MBI3117642.1 PTS sugar transporter subunit IIA [Candidatus Hydrogenedentota bacterium]
MFLCELLRPELIKVELKAEGKHEAIQELIDLLLQQNEISLGQRDFLLEEVLAQERRTGSGMERGIAVPHGMTDRVEDILCALGTAPAGIPFDTRDGRPADLLVLLLVPRRNFKGEVHAMAGIQNLLQHAGLKDRIVASRDARAIFEMIRVHEGDRRKTPRLRVARV